MRLAAIAKNIKASGVCGVHYVGPLREVWIRRHTESTA